MASAQAIAVGREAELKRITAAVEALAKDFGVNAPEFPARGKDADLLRNQQFAWMADVLEAITGPKAAKAAPTPNADESPADGAQDAPEAAIVRTTTIDRAPKKGKAS